VTHESNKPDPQLVLFVCKGNQCRSPMAEALLRSKLPPSTEIEVASAGTIGDGTPPPDHAVSVMKDMGLDIAGRPSRRLRAADIDSADLVVTMSRDLLVEVATICPAGLERSFTFADLIDRASRAGGPQMGESLRAWAQRMAAGRTTSSILQLPMRSDITDPIGAGVTVYERTRDMLDRLTSELAGVLATDPG
jgi:protein-tyrosine phosphatase